MNKWARSFEWNGASAAPGGDRRPPPTQHYFAFLSYAHSDSAEADWLHNELERFRVPSSLVGRLTANGVVPRRLTPIFRDRHELAAADDLNEEIREALAASRCLIVLCSPAAAKSRWTNEEIRRFKQVHPEGCIIAAVVGGEPHASEKVGEEEEECFPPALLEKYDRRGRRTGRSVEPLAADLREGHGGERIGVLKIVAGVLGVGLDELVQRDQLRRQRRLAGITAGSIVGMLVATGLALTAIQARDAARDQRREAEGLVEYMIGDLREKLQPIGRLDVLDGVGSRVLDYYSKQDASELSDRALAQRSRALTLMGQTAQARGNVDTALALYRQAYAGTAEAVRRNPDDPQILHQHSLNVFYIGDIARARADLPGLEASSREYKGIVDRMAALEPDNLKWRMEQQSTAINLGILLYNQRRYAEAAGLLDGATGPTMSLASMNPDNGEHQTSAANNLAWLAQSQWAQGQVDAAIATRQREVSFLQKLLQRGRTDVGLRERLLVAHRSLGLMLTFSGQLRSAIEELRAATEIGDRLIRVEPQNTYWKTMTAAARFDLAKALIASRHADGATAETRIACALALETRSRSTGATWQPLQTSCLEIQSRLALHSGATAGALGFAERALESARSERALDPINDRYSIATQYRLLGDVHQRMGNSEAARRAWSAGLTQLPRNIAERPLELKERAELLRGLGQMEEARPLARRLARMGYRSTT